MDRPVLSKYERASTLGQDAFCNGSKPRTTTTGRDSRRTVRELQEGLIPFKLARVLPDNNSLQIVGNGHIRFRCGSSTEVMMSCTVDGRCSMSFMRTECPERSDWAATLLTDVKTHC
jgi:hypothetical protein